MNTEDKQMLTVSEVAERLHVHENTVRNWISRGDLQAQRLGPRMIRISWSSIIEFIEKGN